MTRPNWYTERSLFDDDPNAVWEVTYKHELVEEHDGYCSGYEYGWDSDEDPFVTISGYVHTLYLPEGVWDTKPVTFYDGKRHGCAGMRHSCQSGHCDSVGRVTLISLKRICKPQDIAKETTQQ